MAQTNCQLPEHGYPQPHWMCPTAQLVPEWFVRSHPPNKAAVAVTRMLMLLLSVAWSEPFASSLPDVAVVVAKCPPENLVMASLKRPAGKHQWPLSPFFICR